MKLNKILFFGMARIRKVYNEDFKEHIREEKYRIIHPFTIIFLILTLIWCLWDGGIKEFIEEIKNNICFI